MVLIIVLTIQGEGVMYTVIWKRKKKSYATLKNVWSLWLAPWRPISRLDVQERFTLKFLSPSHASLLARPCVWSSLTRGWCWVSGRVEVWSPGSVHPAVSHMLLGRGVGWGGERPPGPQTRPRRGAACEQAIPLSRPGTGQFRAQSDCYLFKRQK